MVLTRFGVGGIITRTYGLGVGKADQAVGPGPRTGDTELPANYDELVPGHEFPPVEYRLEEGIVTPYVAAVGSEQRAHVPPLAVAARAIASLGGLIALPAGTIHASQEFEFSRLVPIGARVSCSAKVLRKLSRGPMRMLTLEMTIKDESEALVQTGRSTIVLPEG